MDLSGRWASTSYGLDPDGIIPVKRTRHNSTPQKSLQVKLRNYRRLVEQRNTEQLAGSAYLFAPRIPPRPKGASQPTPPSVLRKLRSADKQRLGRGAISRLATPCTPPPRPHTSAEISHPSRYGSPPAQMPPRPHTAVDELLPTEEAGGSCSSTSQTGTMLAMQKWSSAAWVRFGAGSGATRESVARAFAKWLALSCNTQRGSFRSLADLDAACCDMGIDAAEATNVAARLWAGLAVDSNLPVTVLVGCLDDQPPTPSRQRCSCPQPTLASSVAPDDSEVPMTLVCSLPLELETSRLSTFESPLDGLCKTVSSSGNSESAALDESSLPLSPVVPMPSFTSRVVRSTLVQGLERYGDPESNGVPIADMHEAGKYISAVICRVIATESEELEPFYESSRYEEVDCCSRSLSVSGIMEVVASAIANITAAALARALQVQRRDEARHSALYVHRVVSNVAGGIRREPEPSTHTQPRMSWHTEMQAELADYSHGHTFSTSDDTCLGTCRAGHKLVSRPPTADGWACDGRFEEDGCRSGITDYFQSDNLTRWECRVCDYDLCDKCYARLLCHQAPEPDIVQESEAADNADHEDPDMEEQPVIEHQATSTWLPPHLRWLQDIDENGFDSLTKNPGLSERSKETSEDDQDTGSFHLVKSHTFVGKSQTFVGGGYGSLAPLTKKQCTDAAKPAGDDASVQGNVDETDIDAPTGLKPSRSMFNFKSSRRRSSAPTAIASFVRSNVARVSGSNKVTALEEAEAPQQWSSTASSQSSNPAVAVKKLSKTLRTSLTKMFGDSKDNREISRQEAEELVLHRRGSWA